jgi:hypothetical protein
MDRRQFEEEGAEEEAALMRQCGDCQLCCRLLPVPPLAKKAGQRCEHQKFGTGCKVYGSAKMPRDCSLWSCRWLVDPATAALSRPDRSHYVIDVMPDYITVENNETKEKYPMPAMQVWIDPAHPHAHRDPALRNYLLQQGERGIAALIRYNSSQSVTLLPRNMFSGEPESAPRGWIINDDWIEIPHNDANVRNEPDHMLLGLR